jgi:hypothetical protein
MNDLSTEGATYCNHFDQAMSDINTGMVILAKQIIAYLIPQ